MTRDPDEVEELHERAELAERIRSAFAAVPRPDPPITEGTGPLNEDVERTLAGKATDRITPEDARAVRMDLPYLTPPAFVYYLPALMLIVLVGDTYVDGLDQAIFSMLLPPEDDDAMRRFERRMALLDRSQREAIARYVEWYAEGESVLPGRDRATAYWHG